jgi:hypothetical protein
MQGGIEMLSQGRARVAAALVCAAIAIVARADDAVPAASTPATQCRITFELPALSLDQAGGQIATSYRVTDQCALELERFEASSVTSTS